MKKNKMMRLASYLLIATLMTTSTISGTFAKYVTTNSGADSARVAKWGVVINVEDDMNVFATSYHDANNGLTVESDTADNVVAPGTNGSMTFSVAGTPEVKFQLDVAVTVDNTIHLDAGTYTLPAGKFAEGDVTVTTTKDYEPIKFYFGTEAVDENTEYTLTLAELEAKLEELTTPYAAGTTIDETYTIAWEWAFENEFNDGAWDTGAPYTDAKIANFLDTFLGDQEPLQFEGFKLEITATQID